MLSLFWVFLEDNTICVTFQFQHTVKWKYTEWFLLFKYIRDFINTFCWSGLTLVNPKLTAVLILVECFKDLLHQTLREATKYGHCFLHFWQFSLNQHLNCLFSQRKLWNKEHCAPSTRYIQINLRVICAT